MSCECTGDELWGCGDPECPAEPEPVEDWENGYWLDDYESRTDMQWFDRANMRVLTWRDLMRIYYDTDTELGRCGQRLMDVSMRRSPFLDMLEKRPPLPTAPTVPLMWQIERVTAEQLVELYPEREPTVVSPEQYALLQAELEHARAGEAAPVVSAMHKAAHEHGSNRHERRKAAALNRKRR